MVKDKFEDKLVFLVQEFNEELEDFQKRVNEYEEHMYKCKGIATKGIGGQLLVVAMEWGI